MSAIVFVDVAMQVAADSGMSVPEVLRELPTDPAAIFVIVLSLAGIGAVVKFGGGPEDSD